MKGVNMEPKWEAPAPVSNKRRRSERVQALIDAGVNNPNQWFVLYEGVKARPAHRPFNGPQWERAYRKVYINDQTVQRTYVRYIGTN